MASHQVPLRRSRYDLRSNKTIGQLMHQLRSNSTSLPSNNTSPFDEDAMHHDFGQIRQQRYSDNNHYSNNSHYSDNNRSQELEMDEDHSIDEEEEEQKQPTPENSIQSEKVLIPLCVHSGVFSSRSLGGDKYLSHNIEVSKESDGEILFETILSAASIFLADHHNHPIPPKLNHLKLYTQMRKQREHHILSRADIASTKWQSMLGTKKQTQLFIGWNHKDKIPANEKVLMSVEEKKRHDATHRVSQHHDQEINGSKSNKKKARDQEKERDLAICHSAYQMAGNDSLSRKQAVLSAFEVKCFCFGFENTFRNIISKSVSVSDFIGSLQ